nr:hypothetical protein [Oscillospiraceae bacterium]
MISVPISVYSLTDDNIDTYLKQMQECKVGRIFFCGMGYPYDEGFIFKRPDELALLKKAISKFRSGGFEIGIWLGAFGHGGILYSGNSEKTKWKYRSIVGADGKTAIHGLCPRDEALRKDYFEGLRSLAKLGPDILLLDDDFRLNDRQGYNFGCFCQVCKAEFDKIVGEKVSHEDLAKLIFTGGRNKYRDAYMQVSNETLTDFARDARAAIDQVDPNVRFATCTTPSHFDVTGTDVAQLAYTFAGKSKPFTRVYGSPYVDTNIIGAAETARMLFSWLEGKGIEVVSEGDVYPRPRYNPSSSSKALELFNMILSASGIGDNRHDYIVDYYFSPDYESGYIERYIKNAPILKKIEEMFKSKRGSGVRVISAEHKIRDTQLPEEICDSTLKTVMINGVSSPATELLSKNSIPTTYSGEGLPLLVFGQSAATVTEEQLKQGAILDVKAAEILRDRGVDTGILYSEKKTFDAERFVKEGGIAKVINNGAQYELTLKESAEVISEYLPSATPSSYRYENALGQRFFVIAYDGLLAKKCPNFTNSYYRQKTLFEAIEWMNGNALPVKSYKNPNLYTITARDENSLSALLVNVNLDDVFYPVFTLDKEYKEISFLNCTGRLEGNKVIIESDIPAYGYAGFEVK